MLAASKALGCGEAGKVLGGMDGGSGQEHAAQKISSDADDPRPLCGPGTITAHRLCLSR